MLTNIIATLIVAVTTNTYAPKQWLEVTTYMEGGRSERWMDHKPWGGGGWYNGTPRNQEPQSRDNPDVRITEVREVKTLSFDFDGKMWTAEISNTVLSAARKKRVVTSATTVTNGVTITTTAERWANE